MNRDEFRAYTDAYLDAQRTLQSLRATRRTLEWALGQTPSTQVFSDDIEALKDCVEQMDKSVKLLLEEQSNTHCKTLGQLLGLALNMGETDEET